MPPIENSAESAKIISKQIRPTPVRFPKNPKTANDAIEIIRSPFGGRDLVVAVGSGPIDDFTHLIKSDRIAKGKIEFRRRISRCAFSGGALPFPSTREFGVPPLANFSYMGSFPLREGRALSPPLALDS